MALWDAFISHAHEDKEPIARPLASALSAAGLVVWYDEFSLLAGDSLREAIDHGLAQSRYGVVILSHAFFAKQWPQRELSALVGRESNGKVVLPVWHGISAQEVRSFSPLLADRVAIQSAPGIDHVVRELLRAMNLPFSGDDVSGTWFGRSGRLRIFRSGELVEGDYDWNGHDWAGHFRGSFAGSEMKVQWWWDISAERGDGVLALHGRSLIVSYG